VTRIANSLGLETQTVPVQYITASRLKNDQKPGETRTTNLALSKEIITYHLLSTIQPHCTVLPQILCSFASTLTILVTLAGTHRPTWPRQSIPAPSLHRPHQGCLLPKILPCFNFYALPLPQKVFPSPSSAHGLLDFSPNSTI
jgi:hypothetical protein